jgi:superfamily II DNA or RNA helicase
MKVSPLVPFQIVYSMYEHEYLGYLFEPFVVQLNARGQLTLQTQNIWSKNAQEFANGLDETDFKLIKWMDAIQQEVVAQKFNPKKSTAVDFFLRVYDPQKGDKLLQEGIQGYLTNIKAEILQALLPTKRLFIMSKDGDPIRTEIQIKPLPARILFHFMRNADNTHYFPTIKYEDQKIEFQYRNALLLNDEPAWLLVDQQLYHFDKDVDAKKLRPFLNKKFILIPKNIEESYYRKFVLPLITTFDVHAKGFQIKTEHFKPTPILELTQAVNTAQQAGLFGSNVPEISQELCVTLYFRYGSQAFRFDSFAAQANVTMEKAEESYLFHKIVKDLTFERQILFYLKQQGLELNHGRSLLNKFTLLEWLAAHNQQLNEKNIEVKQNMGLTKAYYLGNSYFNVAITENTDWFDVHCTVKFGEFEIPFIKLRNTILAKKREFQLPNGQIALIPEAWLSQYSELFAFTKHGTDSQTGQLQKHHFALVQNLGNDSLAQIVISRRLESLATFKSIGEYPLPLHFKGTLRPYQKAGYDWMRFLQDYHLGGCLADDMGLGKTVQTLCLLQAHVEAGKIGPSLIIMPTSLVYNWQMEAKRFTPKLKVHIYNGYSRSKDIQYFQQFDLIISTYGIVRVDIDAFKSFKFDYIILDESQAIKNPTAIISQAVMELQSTHRLVLTGTPLENSTLDLWSQMSFVNPGLLGSQTFFKNEYLLPIEKNADELKLQKLHSLIKPFILRRHKSQVATELPPKIESIHYCEMTEAQAEAYETAKSYFRNIILQAIDKDGINRSQLAILQGLNKLRQIANHPVMVDDTYQNGSGKFDEIISKIETAIHEGHKVLIFSQFVKHLTIVRQYFDQQQYQYAYLDGATTHRQAQVDLFQTDSSVKLFLISLKAGGLGLNLTAADYVFLLDPWWNPAVEDQAVDRAYRIGQQKTVFTYKMITKDTVEEKILHLQNNKRKLAKSLISIEESFAKNLSKADVEMLFT